MFVFISYKEIEKERYHFVRIIIPIRFTHVPLNNIEEYLMYSFTLGCPTKVIIYLFNTLSQTNMNIVTKPEEADWYVA